MAQLYGLSAYDAAYLVLALDTGGILLTRDTQVARAATQAGIRQD